MSVRWTRNTAPHTAQLAAARRLMQQVTLVPSVQFATPSPSPASQEKVETSDHGHTKEIHRFPTVFKKMPSWPHAKVVQFSTKEDAEKRTQAFSVDEYWHGNISRHYENNEIFDAYNALTHNVCIETMSICKNGSENPVWKVTEVDFMFAAHQGYAPLSTPDLMVKSVQYFDKDGRCDVKGNAVEFSVQFKVEDVRTSTRLNGGLRSSNFSWKTNEQNYSKESLREKLPEINPEQKYNEVEREKGGNKSDGDVKLPEWCLLNSGAYIQFFDKSRRIFIETRMEHIAESMHAIRNLFSEVLTQFEKITILKQDNPVDIENLCFYTFYSSFLSHEDIDSDLCDTVKEEQCVTDLEDRIDMRNNAAPYSKNKVSLLLQTLYNETKILGTWYYRGFEAIISLIPQQYFEDVDGVSYIQADLYFLVQRYCILHQFSILKAYCFDETFWNEMLNNELFEENPQKFGAYLQSYKERNQNLPDSKTLSATFLCVVALKNLCKRHEPTLKTTLQNLNKKLLTSIPHKKKMEYWFKGTGADKSRDVAREAFELLESYARSQCTNRMAARVWKGKTNPDTGRSSHNTVQQNPDTGHKPQNRVQKNPNTGRNSQKETKQRRNYQEVLPEAVQEKIAGIVSGEDEINVVERQKVYSQCKTFFHGHNDLQLTYYSLFAADATNVLEESDEATQKTIKELKDKAEETELGDVEIFV